MKQEFYCLGHMILINDRCSTCKRNGHNVDCPDYRQMQVHYYKVKGFQIDRGTPKSQLEKFCLRYPNWSSATQKMVEGLIR